MGNYTAKGNSGPPMADMMIEMSVATRLGEMLREAKGSLSVTTLARRTGISRQHLYRYLGGEAVPHADAYIRLCAALDLDPWELMPQERPDRTGDTSEHLTINELFGDAANPTEAQFPSGLYDAYCGGYPDPDVLIRRTLRIGREAGRCRIHFRLPLSIFPEGTHRLARDFRGDLLIKFDQTILIAWHGTIPDITERQLNVAMLGPVNQFNGVRVGITFILNTKLTRLPIGTKMTMAPSKAASQAEAFRHSGLVHIADTPDYVQGYFLAAREAPHVIRSVPSEHAAGWADTLRRTPYPGRTTVAVR